MRGTLAQRFEAMTCPEPNTGCLLWMGSGASSHGNSCMNVEGFGKPATHVAFYLRHGRWPGSRVFLACTTHGCVEGAHVFEYGHGRTKPCLQCGSTAGRTPPTAHNPHGDCRACARTSNAKWRARPGHTQAVTRRRIYNLSIEQQHAMYAAQGGRCAACREPITLRYAHFDHDHACCPAGQSCGKCIRGLLCWRCNTTLGWAAESTDRLRSLAVYLEAWRARGQSQVPVAGSAG